MNLINYQYFVIDEYVMIIKLQYFVNFKYIHHINVINDVIYDKYSTIFEIIGKKFC